MANFVKIAWHGLHFGEEPPLVGNKGAGPSARLGAGTIFFTGCNLKCVYCQNYQISWQNLGKEYSVDELASLMLELQNQGALNIDLVSPTIWVNQIKVAIKSAREKGLRLPIVWNSNAYESAEMIRGLEGLVDIYLPDFKYGDNSLALKYSGVKNYVEKAKEAIKEMLGQVGNLKLSKQGIAERGLMVRHLILPGNIENSLKVLNYIKEIDKDICFNLMSQYEPVFKVKDFPEINRNIKPEEYKIVFDYLLELGLENGWVQEMKSHAVFLPDFTKANPFG
ncbi:MAG: radical SAM protein [bacterium]|nr:radical SAM protein [bacterium]